MPSERGRNEVCDTEDVEGSGEHESADAVEATGIPGDLRAVDGQVRGDGALETLLCEDFGALGLRSVLGRRKSVSSISIRTVCVTSDVVMSFPYLRCTMRPAG